MKKRHAKRRPGSFAGPSGQFWKSVRLSPRDGERWIRWKFREIASQEQRAGEYERARSSRRIARAYSTAEREDARKRFLARLEEIR